MDAAIRGGRARFMLELGGNASRNLIIFGNLFANVAFERPSSSRGRRQRRGVGVGLAHYLDSNVFFAATSRRPARQVRRQNHRGGGRDRFRAGLCRRARQGAVGCPTTGDAASPPAHRRQQKADEDLDITWTTVAAGLNFSATYD
jgi:hypothetical protein